MPLRYYQDDAKLAAEFALEELDRIIINLPTGAGKTVVAAHWIKDFLPSRCLFLADQDELCQQPLTVIDREAGVIPALEKASNRASLNARIVVASSQTLERIKRLERFPPKFFKYAIVDEAHRGMERDKKITDYLAHKVIGLTATPFRSDLRDLSDHYQEVSYSLPMLSLMEEGFAPPLKVMTLPVEIDLAGVSTKRGFDGKDYDAESLSTTIAPYYEEIVKLLREHAPNRRIIVFLPLIKSSEAFAAIARAAGFTAMHVDGKSEDRDEILEAFRRGRFQMLCNANVVETGVDIPIADCFVNLRVTRSVVKYQQGVGRICRVLPGLIDDIPGKHQSEERKARIAASAKPDALIIDFLWQHDKLGVIRPGHLVCNNAEDVKAFYAKAKKDHTPEDLIRIAKLVQEERESLLVKNLESAATRGGKKVEAAEFGYLVGSRDIMTYDPLGGWEAAPASKSQLERLAKWGIDGVENAGMARKLMAECLHRFKYNLASINQLKALARLGITVDAQRLGYQEASRLISETKISRMRN